MTDYARDELFRVIEGHAFRDIMILELGLEWVRMIIDVSRIFGCTVYGINSNLQCFRLRGFHCKRSLKEDTICGTAG